ncbi:MAG: hypothetical protein IPH09_04355 [bacterium]|nr:hypothetical protein [bacterium]
MMRRWLLPLSILALAAVRVAAQAPDLSPHGDLDVRCEVCHDASSWTVPWPSPSFDHATTGYVLTGRHAQAVCSGCHQDLRFRRVASACADCHLDVHRRRFGARCDDCHDTSGWDVRDASRTVHPATGFPLLGAHAIVDCDACHQGSPGEEHTTISADCLSCHDADYEATRDPDHAANGFSTDCVSCHGMTASGWGSGSFIHSPAFPLTGAHAAATCASCHATGYAGTPTDCYACHRPDYEGTDDPGHVAAGFSTDCRLCHSDASWDGADFDHTVSGFPLTGAHVADVLRLLPRHRLRGHPDRLLRLPPARLRRDQRPRPRRRRLQHPVRLLPFDLCLAAGELEPRRAVPDLLGPAPRRVERLRRLPRDAHELRRVRVHHLPRAQPHGHRPGPSGRGRLRLPERRLLPVPPAR